MMMNKTLQEYTDIELEEELIRRRGVVIDGRADSYMVMVEKNRKLNQIF